MAEHRNEHTVEISRPAAQVFPHLVSSDRRMRWMGALKSSEQVTDGAPGLGTRFRDVFEESGQRFEVDAEIVDWQPHERLALHLGSSAFDSDVTQELEERNGATRLRTVIQTDYKSALARLMSGVVTRAAQKQLEQDLERLREILEGERGGAGA